MKKHFFYRFSLHNLEISFFIFIVKGIFDNLKKMTFGEIWQASPHPFIRSINLLLGNFHPSPPYSRIIPKVIYISKA